MELKIPVLQLALDFLNLERALKIAKEAVKAGVDWLEAGTPLIKSEGLDALRALRKEFPKVTLVADVKTIDVGRIEVEACAKAGADIVCVLGLASDSTLKECIRAGKNYGAKIWVDLIEVKEEDLEKRAKEVEIIGADFIGVHTSIDEQMQGKDPFSRLKKVVKAVNIPVGVAGGINSETAYQAVKSGASIIVVGGSITKAKSPFKEAKKIKEALLKKKKIKSEFFKRVRLTEVEKILKKVSTPNISDALHRSGEVKTLFPLFSGIKMVGKVLTVRTYPGDWAKPVEAVDLANKGDVLVIDAGGQPPAVWGELATHGALQKGLSGVVINGGVRDTKEIKRLKFPVFTKLITPTAGEPKGLGEIGVPLVIEGVRIETGDYIVGDDDGLVVIPKNILIEATNRAMSILEQENRLREEIDQGSTLAKVIELLRWEKKKS